MWMLIEFYCIGGLLFFVANETKHAKNGGVGTVAIFATSETKHAGKIRTSGREQCYTH